MVNFGISTETSSYRRHVPVLDTNMAYVDVGNGDPIVFLHGNPTPSYLWRNIIPHLVPLGRCLAPDYVGMGYSGAAPNGSYRLRDHQRYLDAWFDAVGVKSNVILVVHDWGGALGFAWAQRHPDQIKGLAYMEAIVRPFFSWDEWPDATRAFFQVQRTPEGEDLILQKNLFIEYLLPLRGVSEDAMDIYREGRAFLAGGFPERSGRCDRPVCLEGLCGADRTSATQNKKGCLILWRNRIELRDSVERNSMILSHDGSKPRIHPEQSDSA